MIKEVTRATDALFNSDAVFSNAKTIVFAAVRAAVDDIVEGLNEDDSILPTWDEKTVLERAQYLIPNIIRRIDRELEEDEYDDSVPYTEEDEPDSWDGSDY